MVPAAERQSKLGNRCSIVAHELQSGSSTGENTRVKHGDSDTDGQTFTMASRTGLMKQSITTAGDMGDMSPPAQVRCENDAKTSLLRHNRERNATEMDMTIWAAPGGTEDHDG